MKVSKATLFGGALMTAGIANAGVFQYTTNGGISVRAYSVAYDFGDSDTDYASTADLDPDIMTSAVTGSWFVRSTANASIISAELGSTGSQGNFAYGYIEAFVMFDTNTDVLINWDFAGTNSLVRLLQATDTGPLIVFQETVGSGSTVWTLEAGSRYQVLLDHRSIGIELGETSSASLTVVPAPGAAVLAGVAGLAATRRRR